MASRRMIQKDFIFSDRFSELPVSAKMLYIMLLLSADDEGFTNNIRIHERAVGNKGNPLKRLVDANFIHCFDSGVALIMHWHTHNKVRKNTFVPTQHVAEKALVTLDKSKLYRLKTAEELQQISAENDTQKSIVDESKGNESICYEREDQYTAAGAADGSGRASDKDRAFDIFWNAYPRKDGKALARQAFEKVNEPLETLLEGLDNHKQSRQWLTDEGSFIPYAANWLMGERWTERLPQDSRLKKWSKCEVTPSGATGELGEIELAAIKRALAEGI